MPPIDSTTSPAFSQLDFIRFCGYAFNRPGRNRTLGNRLCMRRSSSRASAILLALPQLRSTISVCFHSFASQVAHGTPIRPSCTSSSYAPERQIQTNSTHDNTTLPGSSGTPILVKKFCRLRAFISQSKADSGRSAVLYEWYGRSRLWESAASKGMRTRNASACLIICSRK